MRKTILLTSLIFLMPLVAKAAPLKIVNVAAPAINCVFSTSCSVRVKDTKKEYAVEPGGKGVLRTRTFKGAKGSPAEGLFAYEYRLDLTDAVGTKPSCIDWISLSFGPVVRTLDFGPPAGPDQVFVITTGGIGSIGLSPLYKPETRLSSVLSHPVQRYFGRERRQHVLLGPGFDLRSGKHHCIDS